MKLSHFIGKDMCKSSKLAQRLINSRYILTDRAFSNEKKIFWEMSILRKLHNLSIVCHALEAFIQK